MRPAGEARRAEVLGFTIDQSLVIGARASTPVHASGTLIRTPVRSDPGEDVSAMTFAPAQDTGVLATGELQEPFFLVADHRGRPLAVAFAPETSREARRLAKLIVAQTQVIGPAGAEQRYTTQELDATGVYEADYERTDSGWRRTKRAYVRFHGAPQEMKLAGDTQIALGAGGELRALVTREAIEARGGAGRPVIRGELHVELARRGTAAADPAALRARYDRAVREGLAPGRDAVEARRRKDESITRGAGYAELHGALRAALARPASDERTRDVEAALYGLSALVRLEPEEVDRVAARARAQDASLEETAALSASLGAAGTERATAALEELLAAHR